MSQSGPPDLRMTLQPRACSRVGCLLRQYATDATVATRRPTQFWGARTFGWGDAIPDELLAKTDEYRVAAELGYRTAQANIGDAQAGRARA